MSVLHPGISNRAILVIPGIPLILRANMIAATGKLCALFSLNPAVHDLILIDAYTFRRHLTTVGNKGQRRVRENIRGKLCRVMQYPVRSV